MNAITPEPKISGGIEITFLFFHAELNIYHAKNNMQIDIRQKSMKINIGKMVSTHT